MTVGAPRMGLTLPALCISSKARVDPSSSREVFPMLGSWPRSVIIKANIERVLTMYLALC